jgi:hypothetical protein
MHTPEISEFNSGFSSCHPFWHPNFLVSSPSNSGSGLGSWVICPPWGLHDRYQDYMIDIIILNRHSLLMMKYGTHDNWSHINPTSRQQVGQYIGYARMQRYMFVICIAKIFCICLVASTYMDWVLCKSETVLSVSRLSVRATIGAVSNE